MKRKHLILATVCTASIVGLCACNNPSDVSTTEEVTTEATTEASVSEKKELLPITVGEIADAYAYGDKITLDASYDGEEALTYKSSNEDVAIVSDAGVVTVVGEGTAYIRIDAPGAMYQRVKIYAPTAKAEEPAEEEVASSGDGQTVKTSTSGGGNTGGSSYTAAPQGSGQPSGEGTIANQFINSGAGQDFFNAIDDENRDAAIQTFKEYNEYSDNQNKMMEENGWNLWE